MTAIKSNCARWKSPLQVCKKTCLLCCHNQLPTKRTYNSHRTSGEHTFEKEKLVENCIREYWFDWIFKAFSQFCSQLKAMPNAELLRARWIGHFTLLGDFKPTNVCQLKVHSTLIGVNSPGGTVLSDDFESYIVLSSYDQHIFAHHFERGFYFWSQWTA